MARNVEVSAYMPPAEADDVADAAEAAGVSVSKYIRRNLPECNADE